MLFQLLLRSLWASIPKVTIHDHIFSFLSDCDVFINVLNSLARPSRYVGRKPHRYTFTAPGSNNQNNDEGLEQVKIYLNSSHGKGKGNGTGPGAIYNKVRSLRSHCRPVSSGSDLKNLTSADC